MKRHPSRRDFFLGRTANSAADRSEAAKGEESHLVYVTRPAMACEFEICLNAQQYAHGTETAVETLAELETLERQMSVFRPESEIAEINRWAAQRPVEVEPRLFALLELALRIFQETQGAYDATAGPLWEAWGFARRAGAIPDPQQLDEARSRVGSHLIELDRQQRTIRFLRPSVTLNLGSLGKGYAVDRCVERMTAAGIHDFLIHGGYSSVTARGSRAGQGTERGWVVGLRDPLHPDRRLGEIRLEERALGTSGSQFQSFRHQGRRYGHILDPRTGQPAEGVLSATVLAPTAALADALSTAFYVLGPQAAQAYCHDHPEIAMVLICPVAHGRGWEVQAAGRETAGLKLA